MLGDGGGRVSGLSGGAGKWIERGVEHFKSPKNESFEGAM